MKSILLDLRRAMALVRVCVALGFPPLLRRLLRRPQRGPSMAVRLRLGLERLGVTYVKLGQFLAMRFDLMPPAVAAELEQLFDTVPPVPFAAVRPVIESELGRPIGDVFASFDEEPMAAASIAQVYRATTPDGRQVAVKAQRPGIVRLFEADMRNMRRISALLDALGIVGNLSAREAVGEFGSFTRREMDFVLEGRTADRLRQGATDHERVPVIHWELSTSRVLTMELIDGKSLIEIIRSAGREDAEPHDAGWAQLDLSVALHNLAFASMHQLFVTGFFHADPHPGNILILRDNSIAFVDFGIFGELSGGQRHLLASYIESLALGNINDAFRYFSQLLTPTPATDLRAFQHDIKDVLRRWYRAASDPSLPAKERHTGKYSTETVELIRRHRVLMSMQTILFWRALIALDSSALRLSGYFDLVSELRTFFKEIRPGPLQRVAELLGDENRAHTIAALAQRLPEQLACESRDLSGGQAARQVHRRDGSATRRSRDRAALGLAAVTLGISAALSATAGSALGLLWPLPVAVCGLLAVGATRGVGNPR